jgi:hypothetical protein
MNKIEESQAKKTKVLGLIVGSDGSLLKTIGVVSTI